MPIFVSPHNVSTESSVNPPKALSVMKTSFIGHHIKMGIHDIMHYISEQLVDVVKPMVHYEV